MPWVTYERPPVVEVVIAISFELESPLKSTHLGLFWQRIRSAFPRFEDQPPLPSVVNAPSPEMFAQIEMTAMPPLRRAWFLDDDGQDIIQIQQDRFVFNWKRNANDLSSISYPGYDAIEEKAERYLQEFSDFIIEQGLGSLSYTALELVYVNHLDYSSDDRQAGPNNVLADHIRDRSRERFLPEPSAVNWVSLHPLAENAGVLQVNVQARPTSVTTGNMRVDLAARGTGIGMSYSERRAWFERAHEWVTKGFADIFVAETQAGWGRTA